jgi:periplasmic protein CpxP/Spy
MSNRKTIASLIAAAALAATGSFVYAQSEKPADGGPGMHHGMMGHGAMGHHSREGHRGHDRWSNPAARVEGHLAALKVELKITPAQEQAWQTFATKSRQQAEARNARRAEWKAQKPAANVTAPERLAQRTAQMKQGLAGMEAMTAAVTDLYGVLTPEQKALADKQFAHGRHGGRGGEHGHHRKS